MSVLSLPSSYEYPALPDSTFSDTSNNGSSALSQQLTDLAQAYVDSVATTIRSPVLTGEDSTYGSAANPASTVLTPNHRSFDRDTTTSGAPSLESFGTMPDTLAQDLSSTNSLIVMDGPVGGMIPTPTQIQELKGVESKVLLKRCLLYTEDKFLDRSGFRRVGLGHRDAWIQRQLGSKDFWDYLMVQSGPGARLKHTVASYANAAVSKIGEDLHLLMMARLRAVQGGDNMQSIASTDGISNESLLSTIESTEPVAPSLDRDLKAPVEEVPMPEWQNETPLVTHDWGDLHPDADEYNNMRDGDDFEYADGD